MKKSFWFSKEKPIETKIVVLSLYLSLNRDFWILGWYERYFNVEL